MGIVTAVDQYVRPIGMGLLLEIADSKFVVTARHVAEESRATGNAGCTNATNGCVSLDGVWKLSHEVPDLAVHKLSQKAIEALAGKKFARIANPLKYKEVHTKRHAILGCPQVWSKGAVVPAKGQFGEVQLDAPESNIQEGLENFDPSIHFVLQGDPSGLNDENGNPWRFTTESGFALNFPADLKGISGSPVWLSPQISTSNETQLTGIQTSVYGGKSLIKVTKASFLYHFIGELFPELRPAIQLWRDT